MIYLGIFVAFAHRLAECHHAPVTLWAGSLIARSPWDLDQLPRDPVRPIIAPLRRVPPHVDCRLPISHSPQLSLTRSDLELLTDWRIHEQYSIRQPFQILPQMTSLAYADTLFRKLF